MTSYYVLGADEFVEVSIEQVAFALHEVVVSVHEVAGGIELVVGEEGLDGVGDGRFGGGAFGWRCGGLLGEVDCRGVGEED